MLNSLKKNLKVWVSGGTGFVGRRVVQQGLSRGHDITVAGRRPLIDALNGQAIEFSEMDLRHPESVARSLRQTEPDVVIHLGASGVADGNSDFLDLLTINTLSTVEIARTLAVMDRSTKMVMAGSGFEYGNHDHPIEESAVASPVNAYGVSKLAATNALRIFQKEVSTIVLRIFGIYGPGEANHRLIPYSILKARDEEPVDATPGMQQRDFLYVDDVATAFLQAAEWIADKDDVFEVCNLGSGIPVSLRDLLAQLQQILGTHGIHADYRFGARDYRPDEVMSYVARIDRIQKLLDWHPTTDLSNGLQQTIEHFLKQPQAF